MIRIRIGEDMNLNLFYGQRLSSIRSLVLKSPFQLFLPYLLCSCFYLNLDLCFTTLYFSLSPLLFPSISLASYMWPSQYSSPFLSSLLTLSLLVSLQLTSSHIFLLLRNPSFIISLIFTSSNCSLSYLILSYLILSYLIISYLILSHGM